jgi:RNA polymerase sigma factor (sigma-70 family)
MSIYFPETRWSLIGRLADRPENAALLVELYVDSVARYLRLRLGSEVELADLDDLIQDVLTHLLEHPEIMAKAKPGVGSRFRYFLMTLAYNAVRNPLRRQRHIRSTELTTGHIDESMLISEDAIASAAAASDQPTIEMTKTMDRAWAESVLAQAWNDVRLWSSNGTLEPEVYVVLEESLLAGRGIRDIAASHGMSRATCQRRLARGRNYLQRAIVDRLQQMGELPPSANPEAICELLLNIMREK